MFSRPVSTPQVPPEAVRTLVVACCRTCRVELRDGSRAAFCSGRCRAAWHRRHREEARAARDQQVRALLEAALRKLEEGSPSSQEPY
jgi:hypothetical protein